jgi:3-oxoacyl-[acyl-carrier-protein] synthase II
MKRVVVTGMGAITPIGNNVKEYRLGLEEGRSGAVPISKFDASQFKTHFACEVQNFNVEEFIHRREARRMDPFSHLAMVSVAEAIEMSGIDFDKINLDRGGVIWASGIGGFDTLERDISEAAVNEGPPRYNPFLIPKFIIDIAAGLISIKYGLRGLNYGVVSACASSTHSVALSYDSIRIGRADVIVTGGSEAAINKTGIGGFGALRALSTRNDDPKTASRPFDADRDGFVLGEGAGAIILESLEHAKARNANILAEVVGVGMTADAHHMTAPHPEGLGAKNVMHSTLEEANASVSDIDYINVHGTSTPLGDKAEVVAIQKLFGAHAYDLNISSTKSMTGHLLGAAGAIEAIACILAINHNFVPPTINHYTDDP